MIGFCILDSVFLFVSVTAIPCGILLVAAPDGRFLLLDPRLVEHSILRTYLVPGIALFLVGLASLCAWWQWRRKAHGARRWAVAAGAMLIAFELVQIVVIQQFHMLQVVYLACGTFIVIRSVALRVALRVALLCRTLVSHSCVALRVALLCRTPCRTPCRTLVSRASVALLCRTPCRTK